jgi:hypothetical protein
MLVLDSIERERWRTVVEVAQIVVWSGDVEKGWIQRGRIEPFIQPRTRNRRRRVYRSVRIQGSEIARFVDTHLGRIDGTRSFSRGLLR